MRETLPGHYLAEIPLTSYLREIRRGWVGQRCTMDAGSLPDSLSIDSWVIEAI